MLSAYFEKDETKSILFSKTRSLRESNISSVGDSMKQHETVVYLGCQLDSKFSGKEMDSKLLKKTNAKLKFLY